MLKTAVLRVIMLAIATAAAGWAGAEDLRVQVDHAVILRLDADADIVHVANPNVADVAVESPRLIFVVGLAPGETGLYILDRQGNEMMVGDILVVPNEDEEVTLNRNVAEATFSCSPRCIQIENFGQQSAGLLGTDTGTSEQEEDFGINPALPTGSVPGADE